jgi:glutamate formiminotransferase
VDQLRTLFDLGSLSHEDHEQLVKLVKEELYPALTLLDTERLDAALQRVQTIADSHNSEVLNTLCQLIREISERIDIRQSRRLRDRLQSAVETSEV